MFAMVIVMMARTWAGTGARAGPRFWTGTWTGARARARAGARFRTGTWTRTATTTAAAATATRFRAWIKMIQLKVRI